MPKYTAKPPLNESLLMVASVR